MTNMTPKPRRRMPNETGHMAKLSAQWDSHALGRTLCEPVWLEESAASSTYETASISP